MGHGYASADFIADVRQGLWRRANPILDRHSMIYATAATDPFYHGTRADLALGDLLAPGFASNYADRKRSWIYFSGTLDAAIWGGAEPAVHQAEARIG